VQMNAAMAGVALQGTGLRLRHIAPLLTFPVLLALAGARDEMRAHRRRVVFAVVVLATSAPAFSLVLAARAGHVLSFQPLYGNFAAPYMILLLAAGLVAAFSSSRSAASWKALAAAGTLAALLVSLAAVYSDVPWRRPPNPYADLARDIAQTVAPGDIVVFRTGEDARLCTLYLPVTAGVVETIDRTQSDDVVVRSANVARRRWTIPRYAWLAHWTPA